MRLHILGTSGAFPRAGDACPGYLLEAGDERILLDCGPGVLGRLPQFCRFLDLTAIIISHFHLDHYLDLYPLRYALQYTIRREGPAVRVPLYAPAGVGEVLNRLYPGPEEREKMSSVYEYREVSPGQTYRIGGLNCEFFPTVHPQPAYAVRVSGSKTFVYSGDTALSAEVARAAAGADLFLCEATLQEEWRDRTKAGHLTAAQAGQLGRDAGVKQLVLTHIWPEYNRVVTQAEAEATFGLGVKLAEPGKTYDI